MYTNIPWRLGAECCGDVWEALRHAQFPAHPVSRAVLVDLVLFVLGNAYFCFNNQVFRQLIGAAMGSSLLVVLANCFMSVLLILWSKRR